MKAYKIYFTLFIALFFGQNFAFAQLPPALMHKQGGESVPLRVDSVAVKITTVGMISRTEMTLVFYNDLDRVLEGKLYFPLAEGQTISAFALDIGNEMREGVVVEKQKGRKVFEDIVRRGIDPGLLEYVKGNNFSARVYPIPAKGTRTIRITYEEGLDKNTVGFQYRLPLQFAKVKHFSLSIENRNSEIEPIVKSGKYKSLVFEKQGNKVLGKLEKVDFVPNQTLEIDFPHKGKTFVYQGLGKIQPREYFYASLQPEKFSKPKPLPKKVALVWDISGSTQNRDFEKEFALLKAYFSRLGNAPVELITFNNELRKTYQFKLQNGNWQAIRKQIEALNYDGGTQLGVLDFTQLEADEILFSSDGFSNLGKLSATILGADGELMQTPIHTISSLRNAEFSYLCHLSESTGGHFLNLNQLSAESALELLKNEPYRFLSATYKSGELAEIFPSEPIAINGDFAVSGVLLTEKASITLNFGFNNEVKHSQTIQLSRKNVETDGTVERIWANLQLQELDRKYQENEYLIAELGTEYSIVTRNTSLIVLENLDDYFRYKIRPPKSVWKQIAKKYELDESMNWEQTLSKTENRGIIPYLIKKWEARKDWYYKQEKKIEGKALEAETPAVLYDDMEVIHHLDSSIEFASDEMSAGDDEFFEFSEAIDFEEIVEVSNEEEAEGVDEIEEEVSFEAKKEAKKSEKGKSAKIKLAPWSATSEYVKELEATDSNQRYKRYLEMKPSYAGNTGFYADVADFFLHKGDTNTAILVASNIAELQLDNPEMLRLLASLLKLCNRYDLAVETHKQILELRDDEIQSYRDLALAYEGNGNYQLALNTFYEALIIDWVKRTEFGNSDFEWGTSEEELARTQPNRFIVGVQEVVLEEMNRLIGKFGNKLNINEIDNRIIKKMPLDMRISTSWDSDNFDMDLWVTDPNGEKCFYSHTATRIGGKYTYDNTAGYGPEEFLLKDAIAGNYKVEMNYYGTRSQKMLAPVTVIIDLFTNYGLQSEKKQSIVLRLGKKKEVVYGGTITFEPFKSDKDSSFRESERYEEIVLNEAVGTFKFSPDERKMAIVSYEVDGNETIQFLSLYNLSDKQLVWKDTFVSNQQVEKLELDGGGYAEFPEKSGQFIQDIEFSKNGSELNVLVEYYENFADSSRMIEHNFGDEPKPFEWQRQVSFLQRRNTLNGKITDSVKWKVDKSTSWKNVHFTSSNEIQFTQYYDETDNYLEWLGKVNLDNPDSVIMGMYSPEGRFERTENYVFSAKKDSLLIFDFDGTKLHGFRMNQEIEFLKIHPKMNLLELDFKSREIQMLNYEKLLAGKVESVSYLNDREILEGESYFADNLQDDYYLLRMGTNYSRLGILPLGVLLVDAKTNLPVFKYYHDKAVEEAKFSPKGTFMTSCSEDKTVRFRKLEDLAITAQSGGNKKEEKPKQSLNADEYAYEIVGKTMVIWKDNEFSWAEQNVLTAEQFHVKDSIFKNTVQFLVFEEDYISLQANSIHAQYYSDYLGEYSEFFHDANSIIHSQVEKQIYLKVDRNWQILDISMLNKIAELYQQKKTDKAIRKHLWKNFSTSQKEGVLFNSNTMEEVVFDNDAWKDVGIHVFALQPLALPLLKADAESSNLPVDGIKRIQFNRDKSRLVGFGDNLLLYDVTNGEVMQTLSDLPEASTENKKDFQVEFSENEKQLIIKELNETDGNFYKLSIWDLAQNKLVSSQNYDVWDLQQAGNTFAFANENYIKIYKEGSFVKSIQHTANETYGIYNLWFLEENSLVQYTDSTLIFHDLEGGEPLVVNEISKQNLRNYSFSNDKTQLYLFEGKEVILFDWKTRKPIQKWVSPIGMMKTISLIPNSKQIITTHKDHAMRVWDLSEKQPKLVRTYFGNDFKDAFYDSAKKRIVSEHQDGILLEWEF
jgi:WD40 repeat protein